MQAHPPAGLAAPSQTELSRILRLEVPIIVKLAERKLNLSEVMRLGTGAIIEFIKSSEQPLELLVNNKVIGVGEAVKVGENFGLRITQIGDVKQIVAAAVGRSLRNGVCVRSMKTAAIKQVQTQFSAVLRLAEKGRDCHHALRKACRGADWICHRG